MFCSNCGSKLPDGARFCSVCGAKVASTGLDAESAAEHPVDNTNIRRESNSDSVKKETPKKRSSDFGLDLDWNDEGTTRHKTSSVSFDWSPVVDEGRRKRNRNIRSPWEEEEEDTSSSNAGSVASSYRTPEEQTSLEEDLFGTEKPSRDRSRTMNFIDILKQERDEAEQAEYLRVRRTTEQEEPDAKAGNRTRATGYTSRQHQEEVILPEEERETTKGYTDLENDIIAEMEEHKSSPMSFEEQLANIRAEREEMRKNVESLEPPQSFVENSEAEFEKILNGMRTEQSARKSRTKEEIVQEETKTEETGGNDNLSALFGSERELFSEEEFVPSGSGRAVKDDTNAFFRNFEESFTNIPSDSEQDEYDDIRLDNVQDEDDEDTTEDVEYTVEDSASGDSESASKPEPQRVDEEPEIDEEPDEVDLFTDELTEEEEKPASEEPEDDYETFDAYLDYVPRGRVSRAARAAAVLEDEEDDEPEEPAEVPEPVSNPSEQSAENGRSARSGRAARNAQNVDPTEAEDIPSEPDAAPQKPADSAYRDAESGTPQEETASFTEEDHAENAEYTAKERQSIAAETESVDDEIAALQRKLAELMNRKSAAAGEADAVSESVDGVSPEQTASLAEDAGTISPASDNRTEDTYSSPEPVFEETPTDTSDASQESPAAMTEDYPKIPAYNSDNADDFPEAQNVQNAVSYGIDTGDEATGTEAATPQSPEDAMFTGGEGELDLDKELAALGFNLGGSDEEPKEEEILFTSESTSVEDEAAESPATDQTEDASADNSISLDELERDLFGDRLDPNDMEATRKIDKFYTLYRKNEEFQKLLDAEYDKLQNSVYENSDQAKADAAAGITAAATGTPASGILHRKDDDTVVIDSQAVRAGAATLSDAPAAAPMPEQAAASQNAPIQTAVAGASFDSNGSEENRTLTKAERKAEKAAEKAARKKQREEAAYEDKGGGVLTVIAIVVAVLLVVLLAIILILNFMPESSIAQTLNEVIGNYTNFFS